MSGNVFTWTGLFMNDSRLGISRLCTSVGSILVENPEFNSENQRLLTQIQSSETLKCNWLH